MPIVTEAQQTEKVAHIGLALRVKLMVGHSLFAQLSETALNELAELLQEVKFSSNEKIVSEDDFIDRIFFIVEGKVKVTKKTMIKGEEREVTVGILDQGETIGLNEKGFFSPHGRRTATVIALTHVTLLRLDLKHFHQFMEKHSFFYDTIKEYAVFLLKLNFIKQAYPFSYLNNETIYNLSKEIKELTLPENTILFNKGDDAAHCYLIQAGQVEVFLPQDGHEKHLHTLGPSQMVGEAALLTANKRNASVRTRVPTTLLVIDRPLLIRLMETNESFAESVVGFMLNRIRPKQIESIKEYKRTTQDGQTLVVLHNPDTNEYYQLDEPKYFIWRQLDGIQSLRDLTISFFKNFKLFAPNMICALLYNLAEIKFVQIPSLSVEYEKIKESTNAWGKWRLAVKTWMQKEYFITNVDTWITPLYQRGVWVLFSKPALLVTSIISVIGLWLLFQSYPNIIAIAQRTEPRFLLLLILLIPVSTLSVFAHEAGHAFAAKKFGYPVNRIGVGWFLFAPIAFTDTSALWVADQKPKIVVDIAGIGVDLTIGGLFAILAIYLNNAASIYFWFFSLFAYFNGLKNLSPLKDYDGYFLINDMLDIYQLRKYAMRWLINELPNLFKPNRKFKIDKNAIYYWASCFVYLFLYIIFFYFVLISLFNVFSVHTIFGISNQTVSQFILLLTLTLSVLSITNEVMRFAKIDSLHQQG